MSTWKSALVGSFRDRTQMLALPSSLLPSCSPFSLLWQLSWGSRNHTITKALVTVSGHLFTLKGPQTKSAQGEIKTVAVFEYFRRLLFSLDSTEPQKLTHPPLPTTVPLTAVSFKTELFQEDYYDQSKATVLSYWFNFKISTRGRRLTEAWRPHLLSNKPALHQC